MLSRFRVKTERGGGWYIPLAPECPPWACYVDARRYADLRDAGSCHDDAWAQAERERVRRCIQVERLNGQPKYHPKIRP